MVKKNTTLLLNNGQVYTCGDNEYGQLGRKTIDITPNPELQMIDRSKIKNITLYLLSIGCVYNSVFVLY